VQHFLFFPVFHVKRIKELISKIMKTSRLIILITATLCLAMVRTGFSNQDLPSEEREVPSFSGINVAVSGVVYLVQGPTQKLVVEGNEKVLNDLITEVSNGRLTIRMPNRWRGRTDQLKVYITIPEIEQLSVSGSANIVAESAVQSEKLSFSISGSGTIEIDDLTVRELTASVSGSGRLKLGGQQNVGNFGISISGSGRIDSESLPVEQVKAAISGSGSCMVNALTDLNVRISGSGKVIYTGNPLIDAKISGSGRVVNNN
jgi:hypothetical protein